MGSSLCICPAQAMISQFVSSNSQLCKKLYSLSIAVYMLEYAIFMVIMEITMNCYWESVLSGYIYFRDKFWCQKGIEAVAYQVQKFYNRCSIPYRN